MSPVPEEAPQEAEPDDEQVLVGEMETHPLLAAGDPLDDVGLGELPVRPERLLAAACHAPMELQQGLAHLFELNSLVPVESAAKIDLVPGRPLLDHRIEVGR